MRYELPMGPPSYREAVGKICAVVEVGIHEPVNAGDQWIDLRGHIWTVDYAEPGAWPERTSLTMFCPTSSATLRPNEELQRYDRQEAIRRFPSR